MLIDCLAQIMGVVLDCRLGRILSEEALEEQSEFSGGRGVADGTFSLKLKRKEGAWQAFLRSFRRSSQGI